MLIAARHNYPAVFPTILLPICALILRGYLVAALLRRRLKARWHGRTAARAASAG